jgi:hypothetical protein
MNITETQPLSTPISDNSGVLPSPAALAPCAADDSRATAALLLNPAFQASATVLSCAPVPDPQSLVSGVLDELQAIADAVTGGDMKHPETVAVTQASALHVIFNRLSSAALNDITDPTFEPLMRVALRAQSQCARTLATLSSLKKPSIYAQQLNVANQQIVNNSAHSHPGTPNKASTPIPASSPLLDSSNPAACAAPSAAATTTSRSLTHS